MKRISVCLIITFCFVQNVVFAQAYGKENGHEWVDLGLTSGTKWATCNVGANRPEQYGGYYAWGELQQKSIYTHDTYRFYYGGKVTKYINDKKKLDFADDVAHVNWGGKWVMPTKAQQAELLSECYWVWTENYRGSGVKGYVVYKAKILIHVGQISERGESPSSYYNLSDTHIFLPAGGLHEQGNLENDGFGGCYWSSSLCPYSQYEAWYIIFSPTGAAVSFFGILDDNDSRHTGGSVRAVIPGE